MSDIRRQSIISSFVVYFGFALGFLNTYLFAREGGFTKEQYGLTGLFIALYTFNDAVAVKKYAIAPLILTLGTNLFSAILLLPFVLPQKAELKREIKEHKWPIMAIALLSPAAYILVLEALKYAPLTVVAPARETSILLGVFMGAKVFNEQDGRRRLMASVLILSGTIALSLS